MIRENGGNEKKRKKMKKKRQNGRKKMMKIERKEGKITKAKGCTEEKEE